MKNTVKLNGREYEVVSRDDMSNLPNLKADSARRGIAAILTVVGKRGAVKMAFETLSGAVTL